MLALIGAPDLREHQRAHVQCEDFHDASGQDSSGQGSSSDGGVAKVGRQLTRHHHRPLMDAVGFTRAAGAAVSTMAHRAHQGLSEAGKAITGNEDYEFGDFTRGAARAVAGAAKSSASAASAATGAAAASVKKQMDLNKDGRVDVDDVKHGWMRGTAAVVPGAAAPTKPRAKLTHTGEESHMV